MTAWQAKTLRTHRPAGARGAILVGVTLISLLRGARLDLTDNRLYTLSEGTKKIVGNIEEPVNVYLFFSDKATADVPPAAHLRRPRARDAGGDGQPLRRQAQAAR